MKHLIVNAIIVLAYILFVPTLPFWCIVTLCAGVEGHRLKGILCERKVAFLG